MVQKTANRIISGLGDRRLSKKSDNIWTLQNRKKAFEVEYN